MVNYFILFLSYKHSVGNISESGVTCMLSVFVDENFKQANLVTQQVTETNTSPLPSCLDNKQYASMCVSCKLRPSDRARAQICSVSFAALQTVGFKGWSLIPFFYVLPIITQIHKPLELMIRPFTVRQKQEYKIFQGC